MFDKSLSLKALILGACVLVPSTSAAIHDVFVGGVGKLQFQPETVSAAVGDVIRFTFGAKNHTVTQSSFANPCSPLTDDSGKQVGFFSGFMPVGADQVDDLPQFRLPISDDKPIWAFCQQANHCQQGMVFAINAPPAPAQNSFENWKAKATGQTTANSDSATPSSTAAYNDQYGYGGGYDNSETAATATSVATSASAAASVAVTTIVVPQVVTVTETVVLPTETWTTVYGSYPGSADPTPAANGPVTHTVIVGGTAGNIFSPSSIQAKPRDIIQFEFHAKNHTVTQSTFKTPCTKKDGGIDSGYTPVSADATTFPQWSVTVNDTAPLWFFCEQGNHCQSGMVFSVNAVEGSDVNTSNFAENAKLSSNSGTTNGTTTTVPNSASAIDSKNVLSMVSVLGTVGIMTAIFI